ncbi:MAG: type IV toxin-antitoxin system AbiEi family antitoxin domain-containing protein, partial [Actinomycetota bacterium]|nr:type IV toxin-antitoxin system AbiEi family antitoxin domain-containing protein [Actinomycetota bacterium]
SWLFTGHAGPPHPLYEDEFAGDAEMISWKCYWSAGGAVATGSAAALMVLIGVPLLIGIPVLLGAAAVFVAVASKVVYYAAAFEKLSIEARQQIVRWLTAAAVVHLVWSVLFLLRTDLWLIWLVALTALAALEYFVAHGHEYMLTTIRPKAEIEQRQRADIVRQQQLVQASEDSDPIVVGRRAFLRSGHDFLVILGWEPIGSGNDVVGVAFKVRVPSRRGIKSNDKTTLSGADIEPIAIAFYEELRIDLASDWVHITKQPAAGTYIVSVTTVDALARIYAYADALEWASIKDPAVIAHTVDGQAYTAQLNQHWADVGQSRSGKTSLIQIKWAYITRCHDAVLWVGGVEKLFDAVGPWIEPYLGTDEPLPIDWIANGPIHTANMLAAAMSVARWRQSVPHQQRAGFTTIIVQLDEASFFLVLNTVTATYRGQAMTPTELAAAIVRGAGSGEVWLHIASQRGTNDNWGDQGGTISANIAAQTVFMTGDPAEVGRATGDYKLPIPTHKGEFLFKPGTGEPVARLKAEYIQETDPSKPTLHDGPTISDVAWNRRNFHTQLDPGSARAAGEYYAKRFTTADDIYQYLTNTVIEMGAITSPAYTAAFEQAGAELDTMLAAAGIELTTPEPQLYQDPVDGVGPEPVGAGVAMLTRHRSRADRILDIVARTDGPVKTADIIAALVADGDAKAATDSQVVTNALTKLVNEGQLDRPERGLYQTAS